MNLARVDLNLLVALDVLLDECHVTRAAERMGLSQPGMSNMLARLRELVDDPILVRTGDGMRPTPRALELVGPVREALRGIEGALSPSGFDPATADMMLRVSASDYVEFVLLPDLVERLSAEAPGIQLMIRPQEPVTPTEMLYRGEVDLAIGFQPGEVRNCHQQALFEESFGCIVRADHPRVVDGRIDLDTYVELPHILMTMRGDRTSFIDVILDRYGKKRHIGIYVPHFLVIPPLLTRGDYIVTLTRRVVDSFTGGQLQAVEPPFDMPRFTITQFWHERTHHDPAHRWLRGVVAEVAAGL